MTKQTKQTIKRECPESYYVAGVGWCGPLWQQATAIDAIRAEACRLRPSRGRPLMSKTQQSLWRAAGEAAKRGDLIKALLLFEAGRVS